MKKLYIKLSGSSFGIAFALLLLALPVFAGPAGTPPGGNVDANFNTVTAGTTTTEVGANFKGAKYGLSAATGALGTAAGHFESPSAGVDLGSPNFAIDAIGKVQIDGQVTTGAIIGGNSSVEIGGKFTGTKYGIFGSAAGTTLGTAGYFESLYSGGKPYNTVRLGTPSTDAIYTEGSIGVKGGSIRNDGIYIANDGTIASSLSESVAKSTPVKFNSSIVVDGTIKAKGIGSIYVKEGILRTLVANGYDAFYGECDSSSDRALSCAIKSTGSEVVQADMSFPTKSTCTIYAKNLKTTAQPAQSLITCFNPNGNW